MVTLTDEQRHRFKRNGFLVVEDGIDEALCAEARDALWEAMPEDRDDPASWFARDGDHDEILHRGSSSDTASRFTRVEPFEDIFRQVYDYAEELVGAGELAPPDSRPAEYCLHGGHLMASREDGEPAVEHEGAVGPILQYPSDVRDDAHEPFDYRSGWHVDGGTGPYATEDDDVEYLPFTIASAVYFDEVEPRGGGFTVWPRSHRLTEAYFADRTYGDYVADSGALHDLDLGPAFEITGGPGTLVLWHHNIVHGAAPNHSERIRMAGFQRIAHRDIDAVGQDGLSDIWKMYPALRDLDPVHHDPY
jgi:hypothetical protein